MKALFAQVIKNTILLVPKTYKNLYKNNKYYMHSI